MGQGRSQERQEKAVKQLSGVELANIEAVFHEIATKLGDGTKGVELSVPIRQELAERFRLPGFVAERLFHVFDKNEVRRESVQGNKARKECRRPSALGFGHRRFGACTIYQVTKNYNSFL